MSRIKLISWMLVSMIWVAACRPSDPIDELCRSVCNSVLVEMDDLPLKQAYLEDGQFAERVYDSDLSTEEKEEFLKNMRDLDWVVHFHSQSVRHFRRLCREELGLGPIRYVGYSNYQIVDSSDVSRIAKVEIGLESNEGKGKGEIHFLESLGRPYILYGIFYIKAEGQESM
jgi:hypothetical protein